MTATLDCKFTNFTRSSQLIGMGITVFNGDSFYAEFNDFDENELTAWSKNNLSGSQVLSNDEKGVKDFNSSEWKIRGSRTEISAYLKTFTQRYDNLQIWVDSGFWDWFLLCELLGGVLNLPLNIDSNYLDLNTFLISRGIDSNTPRVMLAWGNEKPLEFIPHNAYWGAVTMKKILLTQNISNK